MEDKELIEKAMDMAKQLDLARSTNYADTILALVWRVEELQPPEPKSSVWEPKKAEEYWYVDIDGTLDDTEWRDGEEDWNLLIHHNVYKTQVQAEKAAKYQRRYNMVLQAVLNLEPDQVVDWKDMNQAKYVVEFNNKKRRWFYSDRYIVDNLHAPLTNKENVQPLLDYLNAKEKGDE